MPEMTSRSPVIRSLAPTESWLVDIGIYVGYVVEVRGRLDVDALSAALESLRRAYPALAAHLRSVDECHMLVAPTGSLPGVSVLDGSPSDPLMGFDVDPGSVLSAVHVVRDGDRASVALLIHHAIADGHHGLAVLEAFWSSYTDIVQGGSPSLGTHGYPDAVEKILSDRGIGQFEYPDPPAESLQVSGADAAGDLPAFTSQVIRCDVDIAALLDLGHRTKLTLNALVSAALILTEANERQRPIHEIPYYITLDMRRRLTPPVETTAGTNVLSFVGFTATDDTDTDLIGLARAVAARLPEALEAENDIHQTATELRGFFDNLAMPSTPGSVFTTNWGAVPALRSPAG